MENIIKIKSDATDIIEHLQNLADITRECSSVVELGVRNCVSTWAFVAGLANKKGELLSVDINFPPEENLRDVEKKCNELGVKFKFKKEDSRTIDIPQTDLLFIDTEHTANHLWAELSRHNEKVKKYIVLHDTESAPELWWAVGQLLLLGKWKVLWHFKNNNGLTVCERIM